MKVLYEQNVLLEVDVPSDPDQLDFELDDDGNNLAEKKEKAKEEPEEKDKQDKSNKENNNTNDTEEDNSQELEEEPEDSDETDEEEDFELPDDESDGDEENAPEDEELGEENEPSGEESEDSDEQTDSNKQNELINKERELFSDLSDKQLSIRDKELRGNYLRVYNTCNDIIENIKLIPKTSVNISSLSFINNKMEELKDFIADYISNTYHTKTYLENQENYQYYIVILNKINKLFKDLIPKKQLSGKHTK